MSGLIVRVGPLSAEQLALLTPVHAAAPNTSILIGYGVPFQTPGAYGVTFRKPGKRPTDAQLAELYDAAPKTGDHFIIAVRQDTCTENLRLLLTAGHELEHVRQELRCPRILELHNLARDFVAQNAAQFPEIPSELFVPVNLHAEIAAARHAMLIVGEVPVEEHYSATQPAFLAALDRDSLAAAADLAAFFTKNWDSFEAWHRLAHRLTQPSLDDGRGWVAQPCQAPRKSS